MIIHEKEKDVESLLRICFIIEEPIAGNGAIIPGGIGQYILNYSKSMADRGHQVTVVCKSNYNFIEEVEGVFMKGLAQNSRSWGIDVYRYLKNNENDIIEFPDWGGLGAISAIFLRSKKGKIITRGHGHSLWVRRVHELKDRKSRQYLKELIQLAFCKGILSNSEFLKREYISDFKIRPKKIDVTHIGIDKKVIGFVNNSSKYNGQVMVYVGGYDRRKGASSLIKILNIVNEKTGMKKTKLIMAGQDTATGPNNGSYLEYCKNLSKELGVTEQIEFNPPIKRSDLFNKVYSRSSVFVSASNAETLGIPFLEAMSVGLPVVTWNVGAAPELLKNGIHGLLFEKGDIDSFAEGVISIFSNEDFWNKLSKNSIENTKSNFFEENKIDEQINWYKQILLN